MMCRVLVVIENLHLYQMKCVVFFLIIFVLIFLALSTRDGKEGYYVCKYAPHNNMICDDREMDEGNPMTASGPPLT